MVVIGLCNLSTTLPIKKQTEKKAICGSWIWDSVSHCGRWTCAIFYCNVQISSQVIKPASLTWVLRLIYLLALLQYKHVSNIQLYPSRSHATEPPGQLWHFLCPKQAAQNPLLKVTLIPLWPQVWPRYPLCFSVKSTCWQLYMEYPNTSLHR